MRFPINGQLLELEEDKVATVLTTALAVVGDAIVDAMKSFQLAEARSRELARHQFPSEPWRYFLPLEQAALLTAFLDMGVVPKVAMPHVSVNLQKNREVLPPDSCG